MPNVIAPRRATTILPKAILLLVRTCMVILLGELVDHRVNERAGAQARQNTGEVLTRQVVSPEVHFVSFWRRPIDADAVPRIFQIRLQPWAMGTVRPGGAVSTLETVHPVSQPFQSRPVLLNRFHVP